MSMKLINIYIIGAQSTGKTTLTFALLNHINNSKGRNDTELSNIDPPQVISEVARNVMKTQGFETGETFASKERTIELQKSILEAQLEEQRKIRASTWFISDRSGLDPVIYARVHVGGDAAERLESSETFKELKSGMEKGLVFVCEPNMDWIISDDFRYMPSPSDDSVKYWKEMHSAFCDRLKALSVGHVIIPSTICDIDERVSFVFREWRKKM